jgi:hypothetical protein
MKHLTFAENRYQVVLYGRRLFFLLKPTVTHIVITPMNSNNLEQFIIQPAWQFGSMSYSLKHEITVHASITALE